VGLTNFVLSTALPPHRSRANRILAAHPEIKPLIERYPGSFAIIVVLVLIQMILAWLLSGQPWWMVLGVAYVLGAFLNHALWVMVHECSHHLIFRRKSANRWAGILADIPQILPGAIAFERYHSKHHSHQGVYGYDLSVPSRWEARWLGSNVLGRALWLSLNPILQIFRVPRSEFPFPLDKWMMTNWGVQAASALLLLGILGPKALVYLLASFLFGVGLHPLGARWIQEHTFVKGDQETYSYYGILNPLMFNIGYHAEHHDFPAIPWIHLPKVRSAAPDFYSCLVSYGSLTAIGLRFLRGDLSLFSMVVREAPVMKAGPGSIAG
jgi:sphingolipid delta-4 desaturase